MLHVTLTPQLALAFPIMDELVKFVRQMEAETSSTAMV
jgi:hypothetical protein